LKALCACVGGPSARVEGQDPDFPGPLPCCVLAKDQKNEALRLTMIARGASRS